MMDNEAAKPYNAIPKCSIVPKLVQVVTSWQHAMKLLYTCMMSPEVPVSIPADLRTLEVSLAIRNQKVDILT